MADEPLEYDCTECGLHVIAFGLSRAPLIPRCAGCQWLHDTTFASEEEREEMRAHMVEKGIIEPRLRAFRVVTS